MRVLACGNRDFDDEFIARIIAVGFGALSYWEEGPCQLHLIHGDCRGADRLAANAFADETGVTIHAYPANWDKIGRAAGYKRNVQMLEEGKPDVVVAFIDKSLTECKGTQHMVNLAVAAGVPTYVIEKVA